MALSYQHRCKFAVILDDPVVDDRNGASAILVGMRVVMRRGAMCRPPRVPDTCSACNWPDQRWVPEYGDRSPVFRGSMTGDPTAVPIDDSDARRVISTVLKSLKARTHDTQRVARAR